MSFTMYWWHVKGIAYRNEEHTTRPVTIDREISGSTSDIAAQNALIVEGCDGWCRGFPVCEVVEEIYFSDEDIARMKMMSQPSQ